MKVAMNCESEKQRDDYVKKKKVLLMYVCVKRNICLNLWLANILDFVFYCRNHHVFSDSQFIATFIEGECYGNVGACPCTGQCSVALLLCVS